MKYEGMKSYTRQIKPTKTKTITPEQRKKRLAQMKSMHNMKMKRKIVNEKRSRIAGGSGGGY